MGQDVEDVHSEMDVQSWRRHCKEQGNFMERVVCVKVWGRAFNCSRLLQLLLVAASPHNLKQEVEDFEDFLTAGWFSPYKLPLLT
jgi:hypothetical protein